MSNLISLGDRPEEERRRIARMGGIESARKKRERKTIREYALAIMEAPADAVLFRDELEEMGITDAEDMTNAAVLAARIFKGALDGNPAMTKIALNLLEETTPQRVEVTESRHNPLEGMTVEELRKLAGLDP